VHAVRTIPYYRDSLGTDSGLLNEDFTPRVFAGLPGTSRTILQQNFESLKSNALPAGHGAARLGNTSGSTGEPARYLTTDLSVFFWHAFALRDHLWHRRNFLATMLVIRAGKKQVEIRSNWFAEEKNAAIETGPLVSVPTHLGTEQQWNLVLKHDPEYLLATATILRDLAEYSLQSKNAPSRLKEVRSFGEPVDPQLRELCRRAWNVPLSDVYSTRETGYIALQCPEHEHFHIQSEGAVVEVVDESGEAAKPGQIGRVVVTPLHNFAMPLIRYDLGDFAEVGPPCPCGRGLPVLRRIAGRVRNMLVLPSGKRIWPMLGTDKYRGVAPVRAAQVAQKSLSEIEMRLVVERQLTGNEERALAEILLSSLGTRFTVSFAYFDRLPHTADGKFEDFISLVA
jgi:phenylacetate-CoA ligase